MRATVRPLIVLLLSALPAFAQAPVSLSNPVIQVDEMACSLDLRSDPAILEMIVFNPLQEDLPVEVFAHVLSPINEDRAEAWRVMTLQPGRNSVSMDLPLSGYDADWGQFKLARLSYGVAAKRKSDGQPVRSEGVSRSVQSAHGLFHLLGIVRNAFELRVIGEPHSAAGRRYPVQVRVESLTGPPRAGIDVEGKLQTEIGDEEVVVSARATTDQSGEAVLVFQVPEGIQPGYRAHLEVVAHDGHFERTVSETIGLFGFPDLHVSTDKPLYQPGQDVKLRLLLRNGWTSRPIAGVPFSLKIHDEDNYLLHEAAVTTSRFGVAATEWRIPESARLGQYTVEIDSGDPRLEETDYRHSIWVTRYELPNFTVAAAPDRSYYLEGQDARLTVEAKYLFGKPVARGHVRVVEESDREWNYRDQRWVVDEGRSWEGDTDASGKFSVLIDLSNDHRALSKAPDYQHYDDVTLAVYFTDPTSRRTEQRKLDLRLSRQAIHVYTEYAPQPFKLPWQFHVTTFYPDGTPASCNVAVKILRKSQRDIPLAQTTVKTNQYGLAEVTGLSVPCESDDRLEIAATAIDSRGQTGSEVRDTWVKEDPTIRVATPRNIFQPGEALPVQIRSELAGSQLTVWLITKSGVVDMQTAFLTSGRGDVSFAYRDSMTGEVTVAAFSFDRQEDSDNGKTIVGAKSVLYADRGRFQLVAQTDQVTYRPGDTARADFTVTQPAGSEALPGDAVLGVVAIDRAVEERARTVQQFEQGRHYRVGFSEPIEDPRGMSGVSVSDLRAMPPELITPELDLLAGAILGSYPIIQELSHKSYRDSLDSAFRTFSSAQFNELNRIVNLEYSETRRYPHDEAGLQALLADSPEGQVPEDPWGNEYRVRFYPSGRVDHIEFSSIGPDELPETEDDFWVLDIQHEYFRKYGELIDFAQRSFHGRTGQYIRDSPTLADELAVFGADVDRLRDPWGDRYVFQFGIEGQFYTIRAFGRQGGSVAAEILLSNSLWLSKLDYFKERRERIDRAISEHIRLTGGQPVTEAEFDAALSRVELDRPALVDAWGQVPYLVFTSEWRYADKFVLRSHTTYGDKAKPREEVEPVNQRIGRLSVRSRGADGEEGTADDFTLAWYSHVTDEVPSTQARRDPQAVTKGNEKKTAAKATAPSSTRTSQAAKARLSETGIAGAVKDPSGGAIPGAEVSAIEETSGLVHQTATDEDGCYFVANLLPGLYTVRVNLPGFRQSVVTGVPVRSAEITVVDCVLEVGDVAQTVEVSASPAPMQTSMADSADVVTKSGAVPGDVPPPAASLFTPRVRRYFPETLLWYPDLAVDEKGHARLDFQLPDSLTTWKLAVVASNLEGDIAFRQVEFETFQPFFLEPDMPQVLTQGDRIELPIAVRNYTEKDLKILLELDPGSAIRLEEKGGKTLEVAAGETANETFAVTALGPAAEATPKFTGRTVNEGDSVEKPIRVKPDGIEETLVLSRLVRGSSQVVFDIPSSAIPGTPTAILRFYPNVGAHIVDSIASVRANPNGCPEQIISSTFPGLLLLEYARRGGKVPAELKEQAARDVSHSIASLHGFQQPDGGFGYWRAKSSDVALTAYALRFLLTARRFGAVDDRLLEGCMASLLLAQSEKGYWPVLLWWPRDKEDPRASAGLTAYVARILADTRTLGGKELWAVTIKGKSETLSPARALSKGLKYLADSPHSTGDPYALACYALAALQADGTAGGPLVRQLLSVARRERELFHWAMLSNTVFYCRGLSGRLETTALAIQALRLAESRGLFRGDGPEAKSLSDRINGGTTFLLLNKDRNGIWMSGQTTVNVLEALLSALPEKLSDPPATTENALRLTVNGQVVCLPPAEEAEGGASVTYVDISSCLEPKSNRIDIQSSEELGLAHVAASWYSPWKAVGELNQKARDRSALSKTRLDLKVDLDRLDAGIGEPLTCRVKADRIGYQGYGMLLAEVGLPPGVDVDRASLEQARDSAGDPFSSYEILPDRVRFYMWPRAGGNAWSFLFRPRTRMTAKTTRSILYDYYNPDICSIEPPVVINVR